MKKNLFTLGFSISLGILSCQKTEVLPIPNVDFKKSTTNKTIHWEQFGNFSLPFKIIYNGPPAGNLPLSKGFSHISNFSGDLLSQGLISSAMIYYNVANVSGGLSLQNARNPFAIQLIQMSAAWKDQLSGFAKSQAATKTDLRPNPDIFVFDIERQLKSKDSILLLKNKAETPQVFKDLTNDDFVRQYHEKLQAIYAKALNEMYSSSSSISSYGDAPIYNTFVNITGNSWAEWTKNTDLLNPLCKNLSSGQLGGPFYDAQRHLSPSTYYYYKSPNPLSYQYLAYLLFQIEVNKAWSSKDIIPFVWLRYSTGNWLAPPVHANTFIEDHMIEATAIFPFFAGAKGLWLWENPQNFSNNESFAAYEVFVHALKRLSDYRSFFEGSYQLVQGIDPVELINKELPVWRGVVKNNQILIAASNPYATTDEQITKIKLSYLDWSKTISIKGKGTYLASFSLD